jgi:hypothetical protein
MASPGPGMLIRATSKRQSCCGNAQRPLKASRSAAPGDHLKPAQRAVLELMAGGLHDDAIAHVWGSARPPSAATSRPSSTASASKAGLPQVQPPGDGDGLASQHIRRRLCQWGKRKDFPPGIPQLHRTQSVTEPLEVESRDGAERRLVRGSRSLESQPVPADYWPIRVTPSASGRHRVAWPHHAAALSHFR